MKGVRLWERFGWIHVEQQRTFAQRQGNWQAIGVGGEAPGSIGMVGRFCTNGKIWTPTLPENHRKNTFVARDVTMSERCKNCQWFVEVPDDYVLFGECRINPPRLAYDASPGDSDKHFDRGKKRQGLWPYVEGDSFCGSFDPDPFTGAL